MVGRKKLTFTLGDVPHISKVKHFTVTVRPTSNELKPIAGANTVRTVKASEYKSKFLAPGDIVEISVFELLKAGEMAVLKRQVSESGMISLPDCEPVKVSGMNQDQLREIVK